ncbi:hypothetical protein P775_19335 [Puniceibacterium antarcticum]|uniref:Uncharacterized protein n=1 Tax=Puniceibacterium antarcticum TaxID=1206336 RepID=A0A2G8RB12_9RHOB|nr:hypothetical protein [Puniceibacterium antarcticum]PIL18727.1 hypothetical protein P775_19335 [Puniceibacterium antarcticum]
MNWKRFVKRANFIWLEIGVAVFLGVILATHALADPVSVPIDAQLASSEIGELSAAF